MCSYIHKIGHCKGRWREGKRKRGGESLQVVRMRAHVEPSIGEKQKEGKEWNKKRGEGEGRERSRGKRMTEGRKVGRRDDARAYEE